MHGAVTKFLRDFMKSKPSQTLDKIIGSDPFALSLVMAAFFAVITFALEMHYPWKEEAKKGMTTSFLPFLRKFHKKQKEKEKEFSLPLILSFFFYLNSNSGPEL